MAEIDLHRFEIAAPAVLTILGMPLAFSISSGMGLGIVAAIVIALFSGKGRENLTPFTLGLGVIFVVHFAEPLLFRYFGH